VTAETPPELAPPAETATGTIRCPRCAAEVGRDQEWCLECGYAARTTLARTPRWKLPVALAAAVVAIALAALAVAFVDLTDDADPQPAATTAPPTAPAATTPTATTPTAPGATPTTPTETPPPAPTEPPTATGTGGEPAP
jgi:hypothetical protein